MKKLILTVATALALAAALWVPTSTVSKAGGLPAVAAAPAQGGAPMRKAERHPEIRMAVRHLRQAKAALEKGAHDFGGHRVAALEATNKALEECGEALKYDRQHGK